MLKIRQEINLRDKLSLFRFQKIAAYFHEFDSFPLGIYNFIQNSTANISAECKEELQVVIQAFEDGKDNPDFKSYALPCKTSRYDSN